MTMPQKHGKTDWDKGKVPIIFRRPSPVPTGKNRKTNWANSWYYSSSKEPEALVASWPFRPVEPPTARLRHLSRTGDPGHPNVQCIERRKKEWAVRMDSIWLKSFSLTFKCSQAANNVSQLRLSCALLSNLGTQNLYKLLATKRSKSCPTQAWQTLALRHDTCKITSEVSRGSSNPIQGNRLFGTNKPWILSVLRFLRRVSVGPAQQWSAVLKPPTLARALPILF